MKKINHINYAYGPIYCRKRNKLVDFDMNQVNDFCSNCEMFNGSAQGEGVECLWEDDRDVENPHIVTRGNAEYQWASTRLLMRGESNDR